MSQSIAASRYAEALFQIGSDKNTLDKYVEELRIIREVFQDNEQLYKFLKHPHIKDEHKQQLLMEAFEAFQKDVVNTLHLLVMRGHAEIIPSVIDHFIEMSNDAKGAIVAKVSSVRQLTDAEKQAIKPSIAKRFNKVAVEIENVIDPSLIGGLRIQVGNTVLDGSVSRKLMRLEQNILTASK